MHRLYSEQRGMWFFEPSKGRVGFTPCKGMAKSFDSLKDALDTARELRSFGTMLLVSID